jgi:hypothetical protein
MFDYLMVRAAKERQGLFLEQAHNTHMSKDTGRRWKDMSKVVRQLKSWFTVFKINRQPTMEVNCQ